MHYYKYKQGEEEEGEERNCTYHFWAQWTCMPLFAEQDTIVRMCVVATKKKEENEWKKILQKHNKKWDLMVEKYFECLHLQAKLFVLKSFVLNQVKHKIFM